MSGISFEPLVRKRFLDEINTSIFRHVPHGGSDGVRESARSTNRHAHRADAVLHLFLEDGLWIAASREHLYRTGVRHHLSSMTRLCDEKLYPEDVSSTFHTQNLVHPRPYPLERFCVGHRPDQQNLPAYGRSGLILCQKMMDKSDTVTDAYSSCEHYHRAIRCE